MNLVEMLRPATGTGVTVRQLALLAACAQAPNADLKRMGRLASQVGLSRPTVTRAAIALEALGWARRTSRDGPTEAVWLEATEAGHNVLARMEAAA